MRRLVASFAPSLRMPAVHVPAHVLGQKTNRDDAIDSLLFFYSLPRKLQLKHVSITTKSRFRFYIKNINLLDDDCPSPMNVILRCLPPSPLEEGVQCPFCGFLLAPQVMTHSTAQALVTRAPDMLAVLWEARSGRKTCGAQ